MKFELNGVPVRGSGCFFRALGPVFERGRAIEARVWRPARGGGGADVAARIEPVPRDEAAHAALTRRHWLW